MGSYQLSKYQEDILNFVENERGNLLVNAKAGSGKTSTLILIANKIIEQNKKCLFLAFNKSIVEELRTRILDSNCDIKTVHSLGLSFIRSYLYRKHNKDYNLEIDTNRLRDRVKLLFTDLCEESFKIANEDLDEDSIKTLYSNIITELVNLVNFCRFYNINYHEEEYVKSLMYKCCHELRDYKIYGLENFPKVIENCIDQIKYEFEHPNLNEEGTPLYKIDFTDMIYFPVYYKMFPPFAIKDYLDCILIDESQDLSILQQNFLKLLNRSDNRFIFVGDEKQAIYGFAGADTSSIENIKKNFLLKELPLNICYRCPENIIKISQLLVPSIEWNKKREDEGEVAFVENIFNINLQPNDIILGRKNKDLIKIYKTFVLDKKVSVKFKNIELVNTLVKEISQMITDYIKLYNKYLNVDAKLYEYRKMNNISIINENLTEDDKRELDKMRKQFIKENKQRPKSIMKSNYTLEYLQKCMKEYEEEGLYEFDKEASLSQYFDIIVSFILEYQKQHSSILIKDFIEYIKDFLRGDLYTEAPIISTVHMMKGGEADNVYIYDYPKFPYKFANQSDDEMQQEKNLQYVALTRAKKKLYLCLLLDTDDQSLEANFKCKTIVKNALK